MLHSNVRLATDNDVRILVLQVGKKVQREDYRAIGRVFKRNHATIGGTFLDRGENVLNGDDRGNGKILLVKGIEGGLKSDQWLFDTEHMCDWAGPL